MQGPGLPYCVYLVMRTHLQEYNTTYALLKIPKCVCLATLPLQQLQCQVIKTDIVESSKVRTFNGAAWQQ
jgi:hypothetical protein